MLSPEFLANPRVKDCCKQEQNLQPHPAAPDLRVMKCQVCGCRHFELAVDPLHIKMKFS